MHHHQKNAYITCGLYASAERHSRHPKAFTLSQGLCPQGKRRQPTERSSSQHLQAFYMTCSCHTRDIHLWPECIDCDICAMPSDNRPTLDSIRKFLFTSGKKHQSIERNDKQVPHTSFVTYEHRHYDISKRAHTQTKDCTHKSWSVCIDDVKQVFASCIVHATSVNGRHHQKRPLVI